MRHTSSKIISNGNIPANFSKNSIQKLQNSGTLDMWRTKANIPQPIQTKIDIIEQINKLKLPYQKQNLNNLLTLGNFTGNSNEKDTILIGDDLCYTKKQGDSFYYGENKDVKKVCKGIYKYPSAVTQPNKKFYYIGQFENDKYSGSGKLIVMPNPTAKEGKLVYDGGWLDNKKEGLGTYSYVIESMKNFYYQGNWKNGKRSGYGIQYFETVFYEGQWQNDKRKGKGKLTINEADTKIIYDGIWQNTKILEGTITYFDSKTLKEAGKYTGKIKDGLRNEQGQLTIYPKNLNFKGNFIDDEILNGQLTVQNFQVQGANGNFMKGIPHGKLHGKLFYASGDVFQGQILADSETRSLTPQIGLLKRVNLNTIQGNFNTGKGNFIYFNAKDQSTEKIYVE